VLSVRVQIYIGVSVSGYIACVCMRACVYMYVCVCMYLFLFFKIHSSLANTFVCTFLQLLHAFQEAVFAKLVSSVVPAH
jgi:hypothetical protein